MLLPYDCYEGLEPHEMAHILSSTAYCFELGGVDRRTVGKEYNMQRQCGSQARKTNQSLKLMTSDVPVQEYRLQGCLHPRIVKGRTPSNKFYLLTYPLNLGDTHVLSKTSAVEYGQSRCLELIEVLHVEAISLTALCGQV
jgi:hypothetical protein